MEAKKDEEEGVDVADSIVFVARVRSFFSALAPRALPPSLAPIRRAHGFLTALQTPRKVPEETLIVPLLYWPQIPQISLPNWKLQVSRFESATSFDRTKLGSPGRPGFDRTDITGPSGSSVPVHFVRASQARPGDSPGRE